MSERAKGYFVLRFKWAATWERSNPLFFISPSISVFSNSRGVRHRTGFLFWSFPKGISFLFQALYFYRFKLLHSRKQTFGQWCQYIASLHCLTFEFILKMVLVKCLKPKEPSVECVKNVIYWSLCLNKYIQGQMSLSFHLWDTFLHQGVQRFCLFIFGIHSYMIVFRGFVMTDSCKRFCWKI